MRHKQTAADSADLSIGGAGPPDEACIVSKGSGIYTHLHIIELGVEQHKGVRSVKKKRKNKIRSSTDVAAHKLFNSTGILFEEVPVDLKLLLEHHLPSIFDDQCVRLQVFCCT